MSVASVCGLRTSCHFLLSFSSCTIFFWLPGRENKNNKVQRHVHTSGKTSGATVQMLWRLSSLLTASGMEGTARSEALSLRFYKIRHGQNMFRHDLAFSYRSNCLLDWSSPTHVSVNDLPFVCFDNLT